MEQLRSAHSALQSGDGIVTIRVGEDAAYESPSHSTDSNEHSYIELYGLGGIYDTLGIFSDMPVETPYTVPSDNRNNEHSLGQYAAVPVETPYTVPLDRLNHDLLQPEGVYESIRVPGEPAYVVPLRSTEYYENPYNDLTEDIYDTVYEVPVCRNNLLPRTKYPYPTILYPDTHFIIIIFIKIIL